MTCRTAIFVFSRNVCNFIKKRTELNTETVIFKQQLHRIKNSNFAILFRFAILKFKCLELWAEITTESSCWATRLTGWKEFWSVRRWCYKRTSRGNRYRLFTKLEYWSMLQRRHHRNASSYRDTVATIIYGIGSADSRITKVGNFIVSLVSEWKHISFYGFCRPVKSSWKKKVLWQAIVCHLPFSAPRPRSYLVHIVYSEIFVAAQPDLLRGTKPRT